MKFLEKYNPKHYKAFLSIIAKIIGKHKELHTWVKSLGTNDILVWLKAFQHLKEDNGKFFEESSIFLFKIFKL